ncbi:hypothetical protein Smp_183240 [Schistosoma mansoni]|uniref:hypothetical protein n=1 Tax=Schistosoma mansoni TaxID=6183 RepID=UPI00022C86B7|nr:hypothetical protein Smp_183240 [Schistosoma mansoni]|eukprot:XP_018644053.1 hypothetical protein Smp_183240 [Schistosoma mansoni]
MRCAAYLFIVTQMSSDASSSVCGCDGVHTWIEETVSKCDDAFECVVVLDQCAQWNRCLCTWTTTNNTLNSDYIHSNMHCFLITNTHCIIISNIELNVEW